MEVCVGQTFGPIGVNVRHVHPLHERIYESIVETFGRLIDFRDTEDVINVVNDGQTFRWYQVRGCVPLRALTSVNIEALRWTSSIAWKQTTPRYVLELYEGIKIAFWGSHKW